MTTTSVARRTLWRITVSPKRSQLDSHGSAVLRDIHDLGVAEASAVASSRLFLLEAALGEKDVERIARELLADPITEVFTFQAGGDDPNLPGDGFDAAIEVHLKGGVMDPVAASSLMAIRDMGLGGESAGAVGLSTARLYRIRGVKSADVAGTIARRLLANDCIEDIYLTAPGRHDPRPDHLPVAPSRAFELRHVQIRTLDDAALAKLSREGHLFLSLEEMRAIRDHYRDQQRDPTDLELETFAQTWSEHCVHKTLKSAVRYEGAAFPGGGGATTRTYDNLLRDTIARATRELIASGKASWCLSVFEDNAGIIAFDDRYGIAFKAETHNHPSAIEPYGGAATGIGGCIRDVMGCGLGAKPVANTDIFCVASPDFPAEALPRGVLHPRRVLKGVVSGVRDYGNRMGIPTVNGAIVFDDRYLGNPLVFCGCIGLIPRDRIQKAPQPGDLVVVLGGRTGRDGIHGATFSSAELTDTHADEFSHAVQIGNAITQKQVLDAQLIARDWPSGCLYTAVTDCGAGGLSSAVGEMASKLGANVDLEKVTLKYSGLRYDEIWISEAQERMVLSVPPANWPTLKRICDGENVEATVIGTFRDDGQLLIRYAGQTVGEINCHFLHEGVPRTQRSATWRKGFQQNEPTARQLGIPFVDLAKTKLDPASLAGIPLSLLKSHSVLPYAHEGDTLRVATANPFNLVPLDELRILTGLKIEPALASESEIQRHLETMIAAAGGQANEAFTRETLLSALCERNAASKEWVIRQYDHEVQGGSVVKPLVGPGQGPSDAAVIRPVLGSQRGIAIANGICPQLSDVDPYWMAIAAIDEAIRNVVCVGGNPERTAILDNFCWGKCDDPETMGALVRACQACYDAAIAHATPFISGKDSLNNEFAIDPADAARLAGRIPLHNNRIRIPGTLLVSAISLIDDVSRCVTMDAKPSSLGASSFFYVGLKATNWTQVSLTEAAALHRAVAALIASGKVLAAHDVSESGLLPALAEMALAGACGIRVEVKESSLPMCGPLTSGYVLQWGGSADALSTALAACPGAIATLIGLPTSDATFRVLIGSASPIAIPLAELSNAWRETLNW